MNLILGTANFCANYGKRLEKDECFRILDRAKELGIETVATAFDYGIDIVNEYGWKDILHKHSPGMISWRGIDGVSLNDMQHPFVFKDSPLMVPFNPLRFEFKHFSSDELFIARSIFCGGQLQRSNKEDISRLCFGFLKSHDVKNCVFGVESIEELELNVRVANEK